LRQVSFSRAILTWAIFAWAIYCRANNSQGESRQGESKQGDISHGEYERAIFGGRMVQQRPIKQQKPTYSPNATPLESQDFVGVPEILQ